MFILVAWRVQREPWDKVDMVVTKHTLFGPGREGCLKTHFTKVDGFFTQYIE